MLDVIKIAVVFTAILFFTRLKWNIGYVLLAATGLLALLYLMPLPALLSTIQTTMTDPVTIKLFFALTLIRMLEMLLREQNVMTGMMEASRNLLKKKKAVIISMPMLIGLLPSLGGAYFSAPMVEESVKGLRMPAEEKGFINYWFRHPWEYVLPLYPGILLASALSNIELRSFMLANSVYALLVVITGFIFSMKKVKGSFDREDKHEGTGKPGTTHNLKTLEGLYSFLPVTLVLVLVIALHIELHYALALTLSLLALFYRLRMVDIIRALKYGFAVDVIVLIFGTMLFKFTMDNSGAVEHLSRYFTERGIPLLPVLIVLPFISGLLTGLTVGFIGSTFPLLISLAGGAHLNQLTLAFAAGFTGVLLSPVHLCLVLTREYFKADIAGIYKKTIPGCCIIMAAALAEYYIL